MPTEPKADWEKEARELCRSLGLFRGRRVPSDDNFDMVIEDRPEAVAEITAALREAHASGAREAKAVVEAAERWLKIRRAGDGLADGAKLHAAESVLERAIASRVGGKETK